MEDSARRCALRILNCYEPRTTNLGQMIDEELRASDLPDKGLVRELVWTAVRHLNTIDWIIDGLADNPARLEHRIRSLLRLGAAQLLYLSGRIPGYAAVNETVNLSPRAPRGMINAVLRRIAREREHLSWPDPAADPLMYAAVRLSHPVWLIERWTKRWGAEETERLCAANNTPPPLVVRAARCTRERLLEIFRGEGIATHESSLSPDGLVLESRPELEKLEAFRNGCFAVQDAASQMVGRIVDPQPGETVVDLCAGAGIKATHLAELSGGGAKILALDVSATQLERLEENAGRLGTTSIVPRRADARDPGVTGADRVLLDAPCSGIGTIRRNPDIKWNRREEDLARFAALQIELLESAARIVKPGGTVVYSTCSTEPDENEEVVDKFLASHPDFEPREINGSRYFQTLPHRDEADGFFAAKLIKTT